ncbi:MAG: hypothetical protein ACN6O7_02625 [Sphingobacterium sp.]
MKTLSNWLMTLIVSAIIFSCSKRHDSPIDPGTEPEKEIAGAYRSNHGEVTGTPIQKTIGVEGGEITVPNSSLKLVVPPGAVDKNVNFSIQEVSYPALGDKVELTAGSKGNKAISTAKISDQPPKSIVSKVYRFLPEDVEFKKDVEIVLPYSDSDESFVFSPKSLRMVYQDKKGYWRVAKGAVGSSLDYTVRVKTRHFSDWGSLADLYIVCDGKQRLEKGESTALVLKFVPTVKDKNGDNDDLLAPDVDLENSKVKEWRFWGTSPYDRGQLTGGNSRIATYTAPTKLQPVMRRIPIEAVVVTDGQGGETVLRYWLYVLPEEYAFFKWEPGKSGDLGEDGVEVMPGDAIYVNYRSRSSDRRLHIEAPDHNAGLKPFGEKVFVSMSFGSFYNSSTYTECIPSGSLYGKGDIVIIGEKDGLITGDIKGELRRKKEGSYYCYLPPETFTAQFRYRKR